MDHHSNFKHDRKQKGKVNVYNKKNITANKYMYRPKTVYENKKFSNIIRSTKIDENTEFFDKICTVETKGDILRIYPIYAAIEINSIKLSNDYTLIISQNLLCKKYIKHLSLESCPLRDFGCYHICRILKKFPNVLSINFSGCGLTFRSAVYIAQFIKYQRQCRQLNIHPQYPNNTRINKHKIYGLKRITLNNNPEIGTKGVFYLMDELSIDNWVKAVDLQYCSITEEILTKVFIAIKNNKTLEVLDLRNNMLSPGSVKAIVYLLNCKRNDDNEFILGNGKLKKTVERQISKFFLIKANDIKSKCIQTNRDVCKYAGLSVADKSFLKDNEELINLKHAIIEEIKSRDLMEKKCVEFKSIHKELLNMGKQHKINNEIKNLMKYVEIFYEQFNFCPTINTDTMLTELGKRANTLNSFLTSTKNKPIAAIRAKENGE